MCLLVFTETTSPRKKHIHTSLNLYLAEFTSFKSLKVQTYFKMSPTNFNKFSQLFFTLETMFGWFAVHDYCHRVKKQSKLPSLLCATVNTWKCKFKHNNVNNHVYSWFCDLSRTKTRVLGTLTKYSTHVHFSRWTVYSVFFG